MTLQRFGHLTFNIGCITLAMSVVMYVGAALTEVALALHSSIPFRPWGMILTFLAIIASCLLIVLGWIARRIGNEIEWRRMRHRSRSILSSDATKRR